MIADSFFFFFFILLFFTVKLEYKIELCFFHRPNYAVTASEELFIKNQQVENIF